MDQPICEICGEEPASLQTAECATCDDCFAEVVRPDLRLALGRECCCQPVRRAGVLLVCIEPFGTEHDHCAIPERSVSELI